VAAAAKQRSHRRAIPVPPLIVDPHSTLVLGKRGWRMAQAPQAVGELLLGKRDRVGKIEGPKPAPATAPQPAAASKIFNKPLHAYRRAEWGKWLKATSRSPSVNIKERLDYSCAGLFDAEGGASSGERLPTARSSWASMGAKAVRASHSMHSTGARCARENSWLLE